MNKLILIGRLTKEPDMKSNEDGFILCAVSLAVSRAYKDKGTGEYESDFFNLKAFSKTASYIEQYLNKGDLVSIEGTVKIKKWEQDGATRYGNDFIIDRISRLAKAKKTAEFNESSTGNTPF